MSSAVVTNSRISVSSLQRNGLRVSLKPSRNVQVLQLHVRPIKSTVVVPVVAVVVVMVVRVAGRNSSNGSGANSGNSTHSGGSSSRVNGISTSDRSSVVNNSGSQNISN